MKRSRWAWIIALAVLLAATAASAEEASWLPVFHADFRTFAIYQNDSDFDDTDPLYGDYGQSVGYVSTLFRPRITWMPHESIKLFYEIEVGDNIWSRNDATLGEATGEGRPIFRHRQFWGSLLFPKVPVGIKAGYMYFHDPTHLVWDRYIGSAELFAGWLGGKFAAGAAQIPDTTYEGDDPNQVAFDPDIEGFDPSRNNFENDHFVFFARVEQEAGEDVVIRPAVYFRLDETVEDRSLRLTSGVVNLVADPLEFLEIELDLAGQVGEHLNGGIDRRDVSLMAGAAQLRFRIDWNWLHIDLGGLVFSADDDPFDLTDNGFTYSGWSKSRTTILTENRIQDQYSNLDEYAAAQRAGLWEADIEARFSIGAGVSFLAVVGYGAVLDADDLADDEEIGLEVDGGVTWEMYDGMARLTLLSAFLAPGEAAGALVNEIDTTATDGQWNVQGAIELFF